MKIKVFIIGLLLFTSFQLSAQKPKYYCPENGNAESNNFTNWATYTGAAQDPQTNSSFVPNFDGARFGVHANTGASANFVAPGGIPMLVNGIDQFGLFAVPSEGTYCFRVGNANVNSEAELMRYSFTVTNDNKNFKFRYAVVLNDGGHDAGSNPSVTMYMTRGISITPVSAADFALYNATVQNIVADDNNPYFKESPVLQNVLYKDWQCVEYNLSGYVGQVVSFCFRVRDCTQNGHFGYAYLDGLCTAWPAVASMSLNRDIYCLEQDVIMDAGLTTGEDRWFIEVSEVDQNNQAIPGGDITSDWFLGVQAPDDYNVTDYFESKGFHFECGKYYHVKLAVANDCAPWNEQEKIIHFVCPTVDAGDDKELCCGEGTQGDGLTLGSNILAHHTSYAWESIPSGFTSNLSNPIVDPVESTVYIVTSTTTEGCIATDTVLVRLKPARYNMEFSMKYVICDTRPVVTVEVTPDGCYEDPEVTSLYPPNEEEDVKWYFVYTDDVIFNYLGQGASIQPPNAEGLLYARYNSGCGLTTLESIPIFPTSVGSRDLIAPNSFTPDNGTFNNVFQILEFGPYAPYLGDIVPAYDAIDFKLRLWNRWGDNFRTVTKADVGRAPNDALMQGDIQWNGLDDNGDLVQSGVYNYTLEMKYCGSDKFERVETPNGEEDQCLRWIWLFCVEELGGWSSQINVLY
jgi:hypothetical protein